MARSIQTEIEALGDTKETWVRRRDAAEFLGSLASHAIRALRASQDTEDVDVRGAIQRALTTVGVSDSGATADLSLEQLARCCEKPEERTVVVEEKRFRVDVRLKGDRLQRVFLEGHRRRDGVDIVRVYTYCGKATPESLAWALRANMKLTHGWLALTDRDGEDYLVLVDTYEKSETEPMRVKESVKAVAHYGDWIEGTLSGLDEL